MVASRRKPPAQAALADITHKLYKQVYLLGKCWLEALVSQHRLQLLRNR